MDYVRTVEQSRFVGRTTGRQFGEWSGDLTQVNRLKSDQCSCFIVSRPQVSSSIPERTAKVSEGDSFDLTPLKASTSGPKTRD